MYVDTFMYDLIEGQFYQMEDNDEYLSAGPDEKRGSRGDGMGKV